MRRGFRFRSADRDFETDQLRFEAITDAVENATTAASEEREVLRARVNNARDLASIAAGTDLDEYIARDPKDAAQIAEYERQLSLGESRLRALDQQIGRLTIIQDLSRKLLSNAADVA